MTIIVGGTQVRVGSEVYPPGKPISGLDKAEEKRLVEAGHCRYPESLGTEENENPKPKEELPEDLVHLGGGTYQLPNGEKVRGKEKALAAYEELKKQADA